MFSETALLRHSLGGEGQAMKQGLFHRMPPPLAVTPNCRFLMLHGTGVRVVGLVPRLPLTLPLAARNWSWLCAGDPALAMFDQDWLGAGHARLFFPLAPVLYHHFRPVAKWLLIFKNNHFANI